VDEIKLFEVLQQQPPSDAARMREAARARLTTVMSGPPAPRRHRRGRLALAAAAVAAAGASLAVTALLPAAHQPSHQPTVRLAAWTVAKQANGTIEVTISQLRDPAGLQSTLRADGVPATVHLVGQPGPACQPYPAPKALLNRIYQAGPGAGNTYVLIIDPSAIPGGAGLQISAAVQQSPGGGGAVQALGAGLVQASRQCTGS
jgi:hypothetical protein